MYIGVDVGGSSIAAGLVDTDCNILWKDSLPANPKRGMNAVIKDILTLSDNAARAAGVKKSDIRWIGIGLPGAMNRDSGVLIRASNLPYDNTPVSKIIGDLWNVPVYIENDANAAALGEVYAGAARDVSNVVMLTLGTGIGGGIVINKRIYTGFNGLAGEVGHMTIEVGGRRCTCGRNGCFEAYASATGLINLTREAMSRNPSSLMWQISPDLGSVSGHVAFRAAKQGDESGRSVVTQFLDYLACGVANIVGILQPELICIGGGISNEGDSLIVPLSERVHACCYTDKLPQPQIRKATLGNNAGIIGAAMLGY